MKNKANCWHATEEDATSCVQACWACSSMYQIEGGPGKEAGGKKSKKGTCCLCLKPGSHPAELGGPGGQIRYYCSDTCEVQCDARPVRWKSVPFKCLRCPPDLHRSFPDKQGLDTHMGRRHPKDKDLQDVASGLGQIANLITASAIEIAGKQFVDAASALAERRPSASTTFESSINTTIESIKTRRAHLFP